MSFVHANTAGDLIAALQRLDPRTPVYVNQPMVVYSSEAPLSGVTLTSKRGRKGAVPVAIIRA